jgi:hypothetical protein
MTFNTKHWLKFSLINLLIVASLGVLMRYKIGFDFPYFSQKNAQHAHSHFAFAGWVTHTLYVLMIYFLSQKMVLSNIKQYNNLIVANLFCSYGMLISFFYQGYGVASIILSSLTIVVACVFAYYFIRDLKSIDNSNPAKQWFKAALWFNIISSIGTFYLAYMMASRSFNEHWYLAAIYFYLHSCMGLLMNRMNDLFPEFKYDKIIFKLFFVSFVPAYFLSILWANLPTWLYIIVVIAAFIQVIAWIKFLLNVKTAISFGINFNQFTKYLLLFIAIAFSIKILLQLGSTIPVVSQLAFGFRPVVIAYLHLVLLAVISAFLLTYMYMFKLIKISKLTVIAYSIFVVGIFVNELALGLQGVASFSYLPIKYINEILFVISLILLLGAILIVVSQRRKATNTTLNS